MNWYKKATTEIKRFQPVRLQLKHPNERELHTDLDANGYTKVMYFISDEGNAYRVSEYKGLPPYSFNKDNWNIEIA